MEKCLRAAKPHQLVHRPWGTVLMAPQPVRRRTRDPTHRCSTSQHPKTTTCLRTPGRAWSSTWQPMQHPMVHIQLLQYACTRLHTVNAALLLSKNAQLLQRLLCVPSGGYGGHQGCNGWLTPVASYTGCGSMRDLHTASYARIARGAGTPQTYPAAVATHAQVIADPELFHRTLTDLNNAVGAKMSKMMRLGGQELNLHLLYQRVCAQCCSL